MDDYLFPLEEMRSVKSLTNIIVELDRVDTSSNGGPWKLVCNLDRNLRCTWIRAGAPGSIEISGAPGYEQAGEQATVRQSRDQVRS